MRTTLTTVEVCACPLGLSGCGHERVADKPLTPVTIQAVGEYRGQEPSRYSAAVEANTRVDVAFRLGGYIAEFQQVNGRPVEEGDYVKRGTMLARLRQADFEVKVSEAESQLSQATAAVAQANSLMREAETGLAHAKLDFQRASNLFQSQSLTKPEYDGAKTALDMNELKCEEARAGVALAQSRLAGARAQVEEARLAAGDSVLTAPLDGWVLKRNVELGSLVGPGVPVFVLADTRIVKVVFGAPDLVVPELRIGRELPIQTDAFPERRFTGRIARVSPAADPRSRVFEVEVSVANPDNALKPGMVASLEVPAAKLAAPVPAVPFEAVVQAGDHADSYSVFVLDRRGAEVVARSRTVRLGQVFGNSVAVSQGLAAGEQVIVSGATLIRDGEPVQVVVRE